MQCRDDPTAFLLLSWRLCLDWILKHVSMGGGQCCCIRKCHSRSHRRSGRTVDKGICFLTIPTWEKQDPILCISGARPCYGSRHGSNPLPRTQSQNWMFLNPIAIKYSFFSPFFSIRFDRFKQLLSQTKKGTQETTIAGSGTRARSSQDGALSQHDVMHLHIPHLYTLVHKWCKSWTMKSFSFKKL